MRKLLACTRFGEHFRPLYFIAVSEKPNKPVPSGPPEAPKGPKPAEPPPPIEVIDISDVGPTDDEARRRAVADVVAHARRIDLEIKRAKPIEYYRVRPTVLAVLAIPLLALCLHAYVTRAPWVFGPDPAAVAPAQRAAHLRFAMFLAAQRVTAHRAASGGTLPQSLAAAGEEWPGVDYSVVGDTLFQLTAAAPPGDTITYRSDEDLRAFLGTSARYLREAPSAPQP